MKEKSIAIPLTPEQSRANKARCCIADLRFLLTISRDHAAIRDLVNEHIDRVTQYPTDQNLKNAWRFCAYVHEQIRNQ